MRLSVSSTVHNPQGLEDRRRVRPPRGSLGTGERRPRWELRYRGLCLGPPLPNGPGVGQTTRLWSGLGWMSYREGGGRAVLHRSGSSCRPWDRDWSPTRSRVGKERVGDGGYFTLDSTGSQLVKRLPNKISRNHCLPTLVNLNERGVDYFN